MQDIEQIIKENNLELIETGFFRNKKHITRVKDACGNRFILKTDKIDLFQVELFNIAKKIEDQLCFKVPKIVKQGEGWILMEEIEGKFLNDFYIQRPDWCIEISKKISDSYQLVINEMLKNHSLDSPLKDGNEWVFSRLDMWSKPIIDAGLIESQYIELLKKEFGDIVANKKDDFFGWLHGNIIGDHVIVSGEDFYLIDLAAVPRIGRGYYDFLRALDFMFLKTGNEQQMFLCIKNWMKKYLSEFDESEVRLVFAFRNIGILGWDILHEKVEYTHGDIKEKKRLALKFIKREYKDNEN